MSRAISNTTLKKVELCFWYVLTQENLTLSLSVSSYRNNEILAKQVIVPFFDRLRKDLGTIPRETRTLEEIRIRSLFKWPYTEYVAFY